MIILHISYVYERIGRIYIICCLNNIMENPSLNFTKIITAANGKLATPENANKNNYTVTFSYDKKPTILY